MPITQKLLTFQKQGITLIKVGENPHFQSKFVPLNEVLLKIKKPLNDLNILIIQRPTVEGLETVLTDTEDDSSIVGVMPWLDTDNPQKRLACMTYYRRGSLVSLLGLEDEDDDGNKSSAPKKGKGVVARNDAPFGENSTEEKSFSID